PSRVPPDWDAMSIEELWRHFSSNRPTPQVTIEALMFSLRRGVNELIKPDTLRRLSALAKDQLEAVCLRVQAFEPKIAGPWSPEDVDLVISAWRKFREQH